MDDELTAYHEAGHVVMGVMLGGQLRSATIAYEAEDAFVRYGACEFAWRLDGITPRAHARREIQTALAGPVAEQIYDGNAPEIRITVESSSDWVYASTYAERFIRERAKRTAYLFAIAEEIRDLYRNDDVWAAVASTADELLAHEQLEGEELQDTIEFWLGRSS